MNSALTVTEPEIAGENASNESAIAVGNRGINEEAVDAHLRETNQHQFKRPEVHWCHPVSNQSKQFS